MQHRVSRQVFFEEFFLHTCGISVMPGNELATLFPFQTEEAWNVYLPIMDYCYILGVWIGIGLCIALSELFSEPRRI
jgi:hypothetical protein